MQYRKFGNTDMMVSEIGFGAWAIGGGAMVGNIPIGWGNTEDDVSVKAIHAALDAGINFFDTADIYGLGHSEELLGKTIGNKKDIIIATKAGNVDRNDQFTVDYSRRHILNACDASLKRLDRESIDFYQLHTARVQHLENGECIEAMQQLLQEGKIRYWGISLNTFEPMPEAEFFIQHKIGNGFQLVLNLLNQKSLPLLKKIFANPSPDEKGQERPVYGVIVRMALQFGLLTGKFDLSSVASAKGGEEMFPPNDHRKKRLTKELIDLSKKALEPVWRLCDKYHCSKTALALSYILSYPAVSTIITGIRSAEQVNLNTTELFQLEMADRELIEKYGVSDLSSVMELIRKLG